MRRIISLVVVALVMAAMMLAMAMPAFGAPNPNSAAGRCEPPGETINEAAKVPGESTPETWGQIGGEKSPGQDVKTDCAPGHQEDEEPI
jgi:hypothetical protein